MVNIRPGIWAMKKRHYSMVKQSLDPLCIYVQPGLSPPCVHSQQVGCTMLGVGHRGWECQSKIFRPPSHAPEKSDYKEKMH
jgi:hypothetical protein